MSKTPEQFPTPAGNTTERSEQSERREKLPMDQLPYLDAILDDAFVKAQVPEDIQAGIARDVAKIANHYREFMWPEHKVSVPIITSLVMLLKLILDNQAFFDIAERRQIVDLAQDFVERARRAAGSDDAFTFGKFFGQFVAFSISIPKNINESRDAWVERLLEMTKIMMTSALRTDAERIRDEREWRS